MSADCGSGGRWFESTQLYQQNQHVKSGYGMPFFVRVRAMSAIALQVEGYGIFRRNGDDLSRVSKGGTHVRRTSSPRTTLPSLT
jgi:hypothetical protein